MRVAFTSCPLPSLGSSDHNLVRLVPKYRLMVQRERAATRSVKVWSADAIDSAKGSLQCKRGDVFVDSNIDELVETVSDYKFVCVECSVPPMEVKLYPNNKPWMTKPIKPVINQKKCAFQRKDEEELKAVQKKLKQVIHKKGTLQEGSGRALFREQYEQILGGFENDVWMGLLRFLKKNI